MNWTSLLVGLLVAAVLLGAPASGLLAQDDGEDTTPGEQFSGVVGVQNAEWHGELDRGAFTIAFDRADDNATKATHLATTINETEERLAELETRKAQLAEQRENGTLTAGQYQARMAVLATEVHTVSDRLNQTQAAAANLPAATLEANGVNVTAIETLRQNARDLGGGEVAEIARNITGDRPGVAGPGERGDRGGPGASGSGNASAADRDAGASFANETRSGDSASADGERANVEDERTDGSADDDDQSPADSEETESHSSDQSTDEYRDS